MTTLKPEPSVEKGKPKGRPGRAFPVTFVVDQQLEACVEAITQNSNQRDVYIKLLNRARHHDSVAFSAMLYQDRASILRFRGTLRRWQGTATKVEAQMTTTHIGEVVLPDWVTYAALLNILFMIVAFSALSFSEICMLMLGQIVTIYALISGRSNHVRDTQIQRLREVLTAEDEPSL